MHAEASILKNAMSTVSESEIAAAYVNAKLAVTMRICLLEMGNYQPATPLEINNTTAYGILTKQLMPKRSKAIDMRFYWLRDCENQRQSQLYWKKGNTNKADYFTKHYPIAHHRRVHKIYLAT